MPQIFDVTANENARNKRYEEYVYFVSEGSPQRNFTYLYEINVNHTNHLHISFYIQNH